MHPTGHVNPARRLEADLNKLRFPLARSEVRDRFGGRFLVWITPACWRMDQGPAPRRRQQAAAILDQASAVPAGPAATVVSLQRRSSGCGDPRQSAADFGCLPRADEAIARLRGALCNPCPPRRGLATMPRSNYTDICVGWSIPASAGAEFGCAPRQRFHPGGRRGRFLPQVVAGRRRGVPTARHTASMRGCCIP